jgi:hypothetical protein
MNKNHLIEYVRDRRNNPVGVVVGLVNNNNVGIGYSAVNLSCGDSFDKAKGLKIASGRALAQTEGRNIKYAYPENFETDFDFAVNRMQRRVLSYFKIMA